MAVVAFRDVVGHLGTMAGVAFPAVDLGFVRGPLGVDFLGFFLVAFNAVGRRELGLRRALGKGEHCRSQDQNRGAEQQVQRGKRHKPVCVVHHFLPWGELARFTSIKKRWRPAGAEQNPAQRVEHAKMSDRAIRTK